MKSFNFTHLPRKIIVQVEKGKIARYLAILPDYDIFTEADSQEDLQFKINDLIYTYFDIPPKHQLKIWYKPELKNTKNLKTDNITFNQLISPNYCQQ
jgi:hypothetical protein